MKASRTTNDYVKYVHEYLKNYHPYVETAVWPDEISGGTSDQNYCPGQAKRGAGKDQTVCAAGTKLAF